MTSTYELMGIAYSITANVVFTVGLLYFAIGGAIRCSRLLTKGIEIEAEERERDRSVI